MDYLWYTGHVQHKLSFFVHFVSVCFNSFSNFKKPCDIGGANWTPESSKITGDSFQMLFWWFLFARSTCQSLRRRLTWKRSFRDWRSNSIRCRYHESERFCFTTKRVFGWRQGLGCPAGSDCNIVTVTIVSISRSISTYPTYLYSDWNPLVLSTCTSRTSRSHIWR